MIDRLDLLLASYQPRDASEEHGCKEPAYRQMEPSINLEAGRKGGARYPQRFRVPAARKICFAQDAIETVSSLGHRSWRYQPWMPAILLPEPNDRQRCVYRVDQGAKRRILAGECPLDESIKGGALRRHHNLHLIAQPERKEANEP
jgi:hypothetical protein